MCTQPHLLWLLGISGHKQEMHFAIYEDLLFSLIIEGVKYLTLMAQMDGYQSGHLCLF